MSRGQALVELAACAPLAVLLALSAAVAVRIADADAGLEAATTAAADAASRAPDAPAAGAAARTRFAAVVAGYPLRSAELVIDAGGFARGGDLVVQSTAMVDVGWAGLVFRDRTIALHATTHAELEAWRSHR